MQVPAPVHLPFGEIAKKFGTPAFVYDLDCFRARVRKLKELFPAGDCRLFYSIKANPNQDMLRIVREEGLGLDACSPGDLWLAEHCGFGPSDLTYTGVAQKDETLAHLHRLGIRTNLDSISELMRWAAIKPSKPVGLRVAPEVSAGFSPHCHGGDWGGKCGVAIDEVAELLKGGSEEAHRVRGLHMHIGSGVLTPEGYPQAVANILPLFREHVQLEYYNLGGGFGTSYHDGEDDLPMVPLVTDLLAMIRECADKRGKPIEVHVEPGEFLSAPAGFLLSTVVVKKIWRRGDAKNEVLILDASMNHFPGCMLYGTKNRIYLGSNVLAEPTDIYDVYGCTNQSGDRFAVGKMLPEINEGDHLVLGSCGAYASARSSNFNEHPFAPEVGWTKESGPFLSTRGQRLEEIFVRATR